MRLENDSPSFTPVLPQSRAIGPRDLHHAKGRGLILAQQQQIQELSQRNEELQLQLQIIDMATSLARLREGIVRSSRNSSKLT
ncbi:hypothetical protein [Synechococcus sp. CBW1006]|uniref:hypothetical protein n=1 Tax=Synechococcus sp. CBW1006 TaxID=1353138 RepID=UPI0018CDC4CF|nr:hypothetical protein [Synechococcus sp. CBW1006]QPN68768.1 hypothetical protein H8F26_02595 [Synechococcus sp. CBW1006]